MQALPGDVQVAARRAQIRVVEKGLHVVRGHAGFQETAARLPTEIVEVQINAGESLSAGVR